MRASSQAQLYNDPPANQPRLEDATAENCAGEQQRHVHVLLSRARTELGCQTLSPSRLLAIDWR